MLRLSRRPGETIDIGADVRITVAAIKGGRVSIGVDAPSDVLILRGEVENHETRSACRRTAAPRGEKS